MTLTLTPLQVVFIFAGAALAFSLGGLAYMEISEYFRRERMLRKYYRGVRR